MDIGRKFGESRFNMSEMQDINFFFNPETIAIVGASPTPGKPSHVILESLKSMGFPGTVFPVNPKYQFINGLKCYTSFSDINDEIDLAVIAVPAHSVIDSLKYAADKKVKGAIVISSGFKETGDAGKRLEEGIREIVKKTGIRVLGPNCLGVYDTVSKVDTFFVPGDRMGRPESGGISILSQSGSFAAIIMDELAAEGIGVARVVSYGNRVDVGESECLDFLAEDEHTKAVAIYLESVDDGRRFLEAASRCARKKPVVVVKVGKREAAVHAARSHTGAMTGRYEIYRAAFRKGGIIEVDGYEGLKDACRAFNIYNSAKGKRVLLVTDGGGTGVALADACEGSGLEVTDLKEDTKKRLSSILPGFCALGNPIDLTGSVTDDWYITALLEGLKDGFDLAIVALLWGPPLLTEGLVSELTDVIKKQNKPVIICSPGGEYTKGMNRIFEDNGVPVFASPESAARAAAILSQGSGARGRGAEKKKKLENRDPKLETLIKNALTSERKALLEPDAKSLLSAYGIEAPKSVFVKDENELVPALKKLSLPLVLKVVSPEILHKSDVGGVIAGLNSFDGIKNALTGMRKSVQDNAPEAGIEGFMLEETAPKGVEVIIGGLRDPQFGPAIMFGVGGTSVELLKDVSYRIAPVEREEALEMIKEVKGYPLLTGFRGARPVDMDKLVDAVVKISDIVSEVEEIKEVEINPLIASEKGVMAVDARVILNG